MSTEETRAQLLADWLSQPPGTDPPEGLEPEVVAAVYAMRPDRAPAPRTSIDDVFSRVTTGPFAAGAESGGELVSLSAARSRAAEREAARSTTRSEGPARRAQRTMRRWWLAPALGVGAAAAAALLLVVPMAGRYLSPTARQLAEDVPVMPAPAETTAAAPPASAPVATPSVDAAPVIAEAAPQGEVPADGLERAGGGGLGVAGPGGAAGTGGISGGDAANTGGAAPAREDLEALGYTADKDAPPPPPVPVVAAPAEPAAIAETESAPEGGAKADDGWFFGETAEKKATELKKEKAAEGRSSTRAEEADEEQVADVVAQTATTKAAAPKTASKPSSTPTAGAAAPTSPPSASTSTVALSSAELAAARAEALPADYRASAATARSDVATAFAEAAAASPDGALAIYGRYMADNDALVAQEATLRAAAVERRRGRNDTALGLVNRTIAAKSTNTPALSMLQLTRGDLYAARGDSSTALAAYQEAARLNAAR